MNDNPEEVILLCVIFEVLTAVLI